MYFYQKIQNHIVENCTYFFYKMSPDLDNFLKKITLKNFTFFQTLVSRFGNVQYGLFYRNIYIN